MNRWLLFLAMVFPMPLIAHPAEKSYSCEAPADIQSAINIAGSIGIPMTWIVDSGGTIRNETLGYSSSSSDWVSQTMKRIENVSSTAKGK